MSEHPNGRASPVVVMVTNTKFHSDFQVLSCPQQPRAESNMAAVCVNTNLGVNLPLTRSASGALVLR